MYKYPILVLIALLIVSCRERKSEPNNDTGIGNDAISTTKALATDSKSREIPLTGNRPADFLPPNYSIQHQANGDVNNDGLADIVMVLSNTRDSMESRPLVVLVRQPGNPAYRLMETGWDAGGEQFNESGYPLRFYENLAIDSGNIVWERQDPGPYGNLTSVYRLINGRIQLIQLETYSQGAGGANGMKHDLLTGIRKFSEENRMKDPPEETNSSDTVAIEKIFLKKSNPEQMLNGD